MKNYLYDIFANKWVRKNGSIYIYSDPHFSDLESYMLRGFIKVVGETTNLDGYTGKFYSTILEGYDFPYAYVKESGLKELVKKLDEMQIKNINKVCGKNDTLIILGDVGNVECVKKLKAGYKVLLLGNHDKGASNYKRVTDYVEYCYDNKNSEEFKSIVLSKIQEFIDYEYIDKICLDEGRLVHKLTLDNHLFDEVYEGPLMINDRVILSHEPIPMTTYMFNIHGHVHKEVPFTTEFHLNVCAEHINYTPINLLGLFKKGLLSDVENIHRVTIDNAVERKRDKNDESK